MSIFRQHVGSRLSRIVIHNDTVYLTGCIAERTKGKSVREQTREILGMIERLLAEAGSDKTKILSTSIYLSDIATYTEMNAEWDAWIPEGHTPARATCQARLPISATSIMIGCIAARD